MPNAESKAPCSSELPERSLRFDEGLLDALPVAVCTLDADGVVLRYNRLAEQLCGKGLAAHGRLRILGADGAPLPTADTPLATTLCTGGTGRDVPLSIEVADDTSAGPRLQHVLATIEALRNDTGQIVGAVVCFQKAAASDPSWLDRRRDADWLGAVLENTPECVKLVARDSTLVQMNPAGLQMIEADGPATVVGRNVFDLIAPECRDFWRQQHQRVCDGEKLSWEFDLISLAGHRRHMETHAVPMRFPGAKGEAGPGFAQLAVTRDITERKRLERVNQEAEQRLHDVLEALPTAVYTTDATGKLTYYNQACVDFAGRVPCIGSDEWCVTWRLYWPDGTPMRHDQCSMASALSENRPIQGPEALAERPDGTLVPFLAYPAPLRNPQGEVIGAVNMMVDITERKLAEDHRQLLLNELNHRVKNTLATVQSIAAQSFRRDIRNEGYQWFEGRLIALSKAHDVLSRENWQAAELRELIVQAVAPFQSPERHRFLLDGPALRLRPKHALALAMALHELCTNAAKYGALSRDGGQVRIHWQLAGDEEGQCLQLRWEEAGGPVVAAPQRKGFGSRLLERGLAGELDARVRLAFLKAGVLFDMEVPLR